MATRRPAPPAAGPLPLDVRAMNTVSAAVFALAALALLAAAVLWLTRTPWFTLRAIRIDGDLAHNSVNQIRANAVPALAGNFFSIDLDRARRAFEAVPWVRRAVVRRVWPDRLAVRLQEHRAVALWQSGSAQPLLVNDHGEVFEANVGDVEDDALPVFEGPDGQAAAMWSLYGRLQPVLARQGIAITRLELSRRGSWRVEDADGPAIEIGRGDETELLARVERFVRTLAQVTGRYGKPLLHADLRHADGYAVRLQGVSTLAASAAGGN